MKLIRLLLLLGLPATHAIAQQAPLFYLEPQSQSVSQGATVSLRSGASGSSPLNYQWFYNTAPLDGATNATLNFTNVSAVRSGDYQVEASNSWGTVRSHVAVLDVDPTFSKVTFGRIVTDGGDSTGVAWGDYDGDGFLDLFVSNFGTPFNFLYHNDRDETFTRVTAGIIATEDMNAEGAAWADFDNDGRPDLFVATGLAANDALYHNDGAGVFTRITNGPPVRTGGSSRGCAWADFDRDGWIDLFVANEQNQMNFLYRNGGTNGFTRVTTGEIATERGNSFGCSWADYDNDGYPDLFVANNGRRSLFYHNQGDGTFAKVTSGPVATNVAASIGCAWGDYDNDGFLDLFVANIGQKNFLYHNNGDGSFTQITHGPIVEEINYAWGGAWADYDNDGYLDLFVVNGQPNGAGARDSLFHNNGDGTFTKILRGSLVNDTSGGDGCAWGDYNNDGFVDLFVSNLNGQNNFLYRNNGNSNHWLAIQCEGRISNASAIGARLSLTAEIGGKSVLQTREISGGGGYGSQNSLRVNFGVGQASAIQRLSVRWPSGIVQELGSVGLDQLLVLREPPQLKGIFLPGAGIFRGELLGGRGNRIYDVEISESMSDWRLLTSITNAADTVVFEDAAMNQPGTRFYRVKER